MMLQELEEFNLIKDSAEKHIKVLSDTIYKGKKPLPGPYAFFHHSAHSIERLNDCYRILKRLFSNRKKLTILHQKELAILSQWPKGEPYSKAIMNIFNSSNEINSYLKQDLETLYMFGGILLDQWSLQAICIGNLNLQKQHPFRELVDFFEGKKDSILNPLWGKLSEKMLWLHYQLRYYRNQFIVHGNRPWQRGTGSRLYGNDFYFFIPSPPGWLDDEKLNKEIKDLLPFAPEYIQKAPDDYWEKARPRALLERVFNNIGKIPNKEDRQRVAKLFGKVGGTTPTFQVLAKNLFDFIDEGTVILNEIAKHNLDNIELGKPYNIKK